MGNYERIKRKENETLFDYYKRITDMRREYDLDYSEWCEIVTGKQYSSENGRKMYYGIKAMFDSLEEKEEEETRILCISDMHIPFNKDIEEFFKYKDKVDILVLNGDIIDCQSMSSFTKMYRQPLIEELVTARELLLKLIEEIKPKKVVVITGNHEMRLGKKIADKIGTDLMELMPKDALAFLFDTGFNHYDRKKKIKTVYTPINQEVDCEVEYVGDFWTKIGRTIFAHPQSFRSSTLGTVNKAFDYFVNRGEDFQSIILSHTHKLGMTVVGERYLYEQGCCADLGHMDYLDMKLPKTGQVNGYMWIVQDKEGNLIYDKTKLIKF